MTWVGLKYHHNSLYKRETGEVSTHRNRWQSHHKVTTGVNIEVIWSQVKECWTPPEAERG